MTIQNIKETDEFKTLVQQLKELILDHEELHTFSGSNAAYMSGLNKLTGDECAEVMDNESSMQGRLYWTLHHDLICLVFDEIAYEMRGSMYKKT